MDEGDVAAALAVTTNGARAALAAGTEDATRIERLRAALAAMGRR
jgi:hypothetical protein